MYDETAESELVDTIPNIPWQEVKEKAVRLSEHGTMVEGFMGSASKLNIVSGCLLGACTMSLLGSQFYRCQ